MFARGLHQYVCWVAHGAVLSDCWFLDENNICSHPGPSLQHTFHRLPRPPTVVLGSREDGAQEAEADGVEERTSGAVIRRLLASGFLGAGSVFFLL